MFLCKILILKIVFKIKNNKIKKITIMKNANLKNL